MSISGVNAQSSSLIKSLVSMRAQLVDLQRQISTGKKSDTYAGIGIGRGLTVGLRSHLSAISSYTDTMTNVGVRLDLAQASLTRIDAIGRSVKSAISASGSTPRLVSQQTAANGLAETLSLLNTQAGDRYIYSGMATDQPAVASADHILNGDGPRAGLKQLISERNQADLGADGLGRLVITSPLATSVSLAEDFAGSVFGLKLTAITTSIGSATTTGPAGSPPATEIDFGATNPANGDTVTFSFVLPDGTTENLTMKATVSSPAGENAFTIGADSTETAANLNDALGTALKAFGKSVLVPASAIAASNDFFNTDAANPPKRVDGPPFDTATALIDGTPADTVNWYIGEAGPTDPRLTSTARIDTSITVAYGTRANEQGIRWQVQNVATLAAITFSSDDQEANAQANALNDRLRVNLDVAFGTQSIQDIQANLATTQATIAAASDRQAQTKMTLSNMLEGIEGISKEEAAAKILAMQTNLQASLQTTAMLYQTSILNYL